MPVGAIYLVDDKCHAAIMDDPNKERYDSGSRGCIVLYGGFAEFNKYLSDSKRNTGRVIIFR
jgi:hypothetical protein